MHEEEFVRENKDALRLAASNPEDVRQVEELIEAAQAVDEHRLLAEIWWAPSDKAMRQPLDIATDAGATMAAEAVAQFQNWQEASRDLTSARQVIQERIKVVPRLLWRAPDEREVDDGKS